MPSSFLPPLPRSRPGSPTGCHGHEPSTHTAGHGLGFPGKFRATLHLTRGPGPWVLRGRRGAWEAYVFLSPCPALNAYLTSLSLMRLLPTYGDFLLPLSFMKRTIHLLSHLRHLAMTGGHQNSHPTLSRNKGKGSQASGSPPVMGPMTHPKQRTHPSSTAQPGEEAARSCGGRGPEASLKIMGCLPILTCSMTHLASVALHHPKLLTLYPVL